MSMIEEAMGKFQKRANGPINPITFVDKDKHPVINPFYVLEDHPNDKNRFAILSTTENGKYVRGGMLVFTFNGIEIYTELKNAIFVDIPNKTVFIKDYSKVVEEITPKDPEERQYILLMKCTEDDQDVYFWEAMTGRLTAYEYIVNNIDELLIDPDNSFVLVENVPYKDALSISNFIRYLKNADLVEEDGFDIEEYIY